MLGFLRVVDTNTTDWLWATPAFESVVVVVVKTVVVALILIKGVGTMCPIFLRHFPYYLLLEMMNRMR